MPQVLNSRMIIFILSLIALGFLFRFLKSKLLSPKLTHLYHYTKKDFFMSRAEHECYNALIQAVGHEYYIFAQVHLATILNHKIKGQNWQGALSHIDRKSVDFVLCDKNYIAPKLAIELDDATHDQPDRQERDIVVEEVLKAVGLPLLRLENHGAFDPNSLAQKIHSAITPTT